MDENLKLRKNETSAVLDALFFPEDYEAVTIQSNIFLRFPDLSPVHPFRCLSTLASMEELIRVSVFPFY